MTNKRPTLTLLLFATLTIYFIAISTAISPSDQSLSITTTNDDTKRSTQVQAQSQDNQTNHDHIAVKKATNKATKQHQQQVNKSQSDRNIQRNNKRNSIAGKRNESSKLNSNRNASSTIAPPFKSGTALSSTQFVDSFVLAQQEVRRMMSYNNTPPVFITPTRDFFVDVTRYPLGTKLTTIRAVDTDADQLEYSIQPANVRDASAHFSINSSTGELRLANRMFIFYPDSIKRSSAYGSNDETPQDEQVKDEDKDDNDNCEEEGSDCSVSDDDNGDQFFNRNLYFLNVAVYDGRQTSVVELKIHVTNSSFFALLHSMGQNSPVELTPGGSRKTNERLNSIIRLKTKEFYDELHKLPSIMPNNTSSAPATIVYPSFINPGLVKPDYDQLSTVSNEREDDFSIKSITLLSTTTTSSPPDNVILKPTNSLSDSENLPPLDNLNHLKPHDNQNPTKTNSVPAGYQIENLSSLPGSVISQPMITSLVLICSCLMITLVLLMFIVPISVKRLRKRLKNVELQHEHLSQRNSTGSSIICSSSTTSSMACHKHNPSWQSQFTVNSDNQSSNFIRDGLQSVCRQSSLDSAITTANNISMPTPIMPNQRFLNRVNNGSIANPMYLQNQQVASFANIDDQIRQDFTRSPRLQMISATALPVQISTAHIRDSTQIKHCDNIYCPIEHDYSTINPDIEHSNQMPQSLNQLDNSTENWTSELGQNNQPTISQISPQELFDRPIESPGSHSSSSSLSSLTRFLSLPARHSAHSQEANQNGSDFELEGDEKSPKPNVNNKRDDNNVLDFFKVNKFQTQQVASKTIARASNVARERQANEKAWELERHKLKFLNPLDKGQFGMVWRCKLKQTFNYEITVAVKTLKNSATKDEREREDLLAEIELMKLVCNHPNVVKMLHCCTTDAILTPNQAIIEKKPIYLVMEYVELGKLQSYLEKSRVNHQYATNNHYNCNATNNEHLTSRDLVKFIYHVAKGMEYISSQCIIHRDLASRNILVSSQKICKIGDFGMARHMQSHGGVYERHSRNSKVPVRWMAPEVLLNNKFTIESDVYSFGILMWEIVTLGSTPYKHLQTEEVIEKVARDGERPEKPKYCHSQLFEIMSKCWSQKPEERPTFKKLVKQLDELLLSANNYIELDQYPDHNYYNIPMMAAPFELL